MTTRNYGLLDSADKIEELCQKLIDDDLPFGFDIETGYSGANLPEGSTMQFHPLNFIVGFSFTNSLQWARYVPLAHDNSPNVDDPERTAKAFWKLLQTGLGVAHNASFEFIGLAKFFRRYLWLDPEVGDAVRRSKGLFPVRSDSMIEYSVMDDYAPAKFGDGVGLGLKPLTLAVFGHKMIELTSLFKGDKKVPAAGVLRFNILDTDAEVVEYACEDALWCLAHHLQNYDELMSGPSKLIFRTELALMPVVAQMELEGIELDWAEIERRAVETKAFKDLMNEQIQKELGARLGEVINVNFNASAQVGDLLYNKLGLPIKKRSDKTQAPSTDEEALRAIAAKDPAVRQILQWRELNALITRYLDKYLNKLHYAEDGRAHANHKQNGAGTGRFSVTHVSYQQWPKPYYYKLDDGTEFDLNYRDFLIAPEGFRIVGFDFSQVELRILAGMSQETDLLKAFADGVDIHRATASLMMNVPLEEVTGKMRSVGKTLNFAIVYGSGAENIGDMLGISKEEAEEYLEKYFAAFPKLKGWMDERVKEGTDSGIVWTKFGRKFRIWDYVTADEARAKGDDRNQRLARFFRSKGDRMAVNAPVQGGAADYLKIGMVRVAKAIREAGLEDKIRLVMTIHDALEFYVHDSISTQEVIDLIQPAVSFPVNGLPEIRADWHVGERWGSVFEVNLDANKKIVGYEQTVALPDKSELTFEGNTFEEANEKFLSWKTEREAAKAAALNAAVEAEPEPEPEDEPPMVMGDWGTYPGEEPLTPEEKAAQPPAELPDEPSWATGPEYSELAAEVRLSLPELPEASVWAPFKSWLNERPGKDTLTVVFGDQSRTLPSEFDLQGQESNIREMLPGAKILRVVRVSEGV